MEYKACPHDNCSALIRVPRLDSRLANFLFCQTCHQMILSFQEHLIALERDILGELTDQKLEFISRTIDGSISEIDLSTYDLDEKFVAYVRAMKKSLEPTINLAKPPITDGELEEFIKRLKALKSAEALDKI